MATDVSRYTNDIVKGYTAVRYEQGKVDLDSDRNAENDLTQHALRSAMRDVIGRTGVPRSAPMSFLVETDAGQLKVRPGRMWVEGVHCEVAASEEVPIDLPTPLADGRYAIFAEANEHDVTALQDPSLIDPAIGVQTSTRRAVFCRVRIAPIDDGIGCRELHRQGWVVPGDSDGRMAAETGDGGADEPCTVPAEARYLGDRHYNYLVRIQRGGTVGGAQNPTFTWSRHHGSVAARLLSIDGNTIRAEHDGPDTEHGLLGRWLEISYDDLERRGEPGVLVENLSSISLPDGVEVEIDPHGASLPDLSAVQHPILRRWDQAGGTAPLVEGAVEIADDQPIHMEHGIHLRFEQQTYRKGDCWSVTARAFTGSFPGDIEWPRDSANKALLVPPHGVRRYRAPLAIGRVQGGTWTIEADCRKVFAPLCGPPAVRVLRVTDWRRTRLAHLQIFTVDRLLLGLRVECDGDLDRLPISGRTNVTLHLELPPLGVSGLRMDGGTIPMTLDGTARLSPGDPQVIEWRPNGAAAELLRGLEADLANLNPWPLLAWLELRGNVIWGTPPQDGGPLDYLDADAFGRPNAARDAVELILPSGDQRKGGTLRFGLRLMPAVPDADSARHLPLLEHLARGGQSSIAVQNLDRNVPAQPFLDLFPQDGGPSISLPLPELPPGHATSLNLLSLSAVPDGAYAGIVRAPQPLAAVVRTDRLASGQAEMVNHAAAADRLVLPFVMGNIAGLRSAISVQNARADVAATASLRFLQAGSSTPVATVDLKLPPGTSRTVETGVSELDVLQGSFYGALEIVAQTPVAAQTSLIHVEGGRPAGGAEAIPVSEAHATLYAPQLRRTRSSTTGVAVFNPNLSDVSVGLRIIIPDDPAIPDAMRATEVQLGPVTVAGGSWTLFHQGSEGGSIPQGTFGSAVIEATGGAIVAHVFALDTRGGDAQHSHAYNAVPADGAAHDVALPSVRKRHNGISSVVRVMAVGSGPANVTVDLYGPGGARLSCGADCTATIDSFATHAFALSAMDAIPDELAGWARVMSDQPVVVLVHEVDEESGDGLMDEASYIGVPVPPSGGIGPIDDNEPT